MMIMNFLPFCLYLSAELIGLVAYTQFSKVLFFVLTVECRNICIVTVVEKKKHIAYHTYSAGGGYCCLFYDGCDPWYHLFKVFYIPMP